MIHHSIPLQASNNTKRNTLSPSHSLSTYSSQSEQAANFPLTPSPISSSSINISSIDSFDNTLFSMEPMEPMDLPNTSEYTLLDDIIAQQSVSPLSTINSLDNEVHSISSSIQYTLYDDIIDPTTVSPCSSNTNTTVDFENKPISFEDVSNILGCDPLNEDALLIDVNNVLENSALFPDEDLILPSTPLYLPESPSIVSQLPPIGPTVTLPRSPYASQLPIDGKNTDHKQVVVIKPQPVAKRTLTSPKMVFIY